MEKRVSAEKGHMRQDISVSSCSLPKAPAFLHKGRQTTEDKYQRGLFRITRNFLYVGGTGKNAAN
jgi:hypothetical protein